MEEQKPVENIKPTDQELIAKASNRKPGRPAKDMPAIIKAAAKALKQAGMTNKEIAAQLKLTEANVAHMLLGSGSVKAEDLDAVKGQFALEMASIVMKLLLKANTEEFVDRINGAQLITGAAILVDKINLITGKPTQITETKGIVENAAGQLKKLEDLRQALEQSLKLPEEPKTN